jgi:adenylate cyclase
MEYALRIRPNDFDVLYNGACFHALDGGADEAIYLLERAVQHGEGSLDWIEHDSDLWSLRDHPRFQAIVAMLRAKG